MLVPIRRIAILGIALLGLALAGTGCVMPNHGTQVFVDTRAGNFWSGRGLLTEVSEDNKQCRVSVRDRALIVQDLWLSCQRVHRREEP